MKKAFGLLLTITLLINMITTVSAWEEGERSGIFEYKVENEKAIILQYYPYEENLVIPDEIDGYPVVGIDCYAISKGREVIKTVTIPEGIQFLHGSAFALCRGLEEITIPESVTSIGDMMPENVIGIDVGVFENCDSLKEITIPESVTSIGDEAFYGCSALKTITIPESVKNIGSSAFSDCYNLTSANVLSDVVGDCMFNGCKNLTTVHLGERVTTIGEGAFNACSKLENINFPESLTNIGRKAFTGSNLVNLIIPENVVDIDYTAFAYCSNLTNVIFEGTNTHFKEENNPEYTHPLMGEFIPSFSSTENLTSMYAFKGSQAQSYSLNNNLEFVPIANVEINGERVKSDIPAVIKNSRVLIPMRAIFEKFGAEVDWNGETRIIMANTEKSSVMMQINNAEITVNGAAKEIDVAPEILMNRTLVPARAVSESLGATVEWDEARQTVVINY